jgi:RimJ/RimL family protein N-acetyltransferase
MTEKSPIEPGSLSQKDRSMMGDPILKELQISTYTSDAFPEEVRLKVREYLLRNFSGAADTRTPEQKDLDKDKHTAKPIESIVGFDARGEVVGKIDLHIRDIEYEGQQIKLGGIGGFSTDKKLRNQGIGTALGRKAMERLSRQGVDVIFGNTDIGDPKLMHVYQKGGGVILDKPYTFIGESGKRFTEPTGGMIAPLNSKKKFELIRDGKVALDIGHGNW